MVGRVVNDTLRFRSQDLAILWKEAVRNASGLKRCNEFDDETLVAMNAALYEALATYQMMESFKKITEFYLHALFYIVYTVRGFLEETYVRLNTNEALSEDLLKRYFSDDFFFKR